MCEDVFVFHLQQLASEPSTLVLYCITQQGRATKLVVRDFHHYFYCAQPSFGLPLRIASINAAVAKEIERCDSWRNQQQPKRFSALALKPRPRPQRISEQDDDEGEDDDDNDEVGGEVGDNDDNNDAADVNQDTSEVVKALEPAEVESIYFYKKSYQRDASKHCRVVLNCASRANDVARVLQRQYDLTTYENKAITIVFRFLIDLGAAPCSWISVNTDQLQELPAKDYGVAPTFLAPVSALSVPPETGKRSDIPALVSLTYDLECNSLDGSFCQPEKDPVIQISTLHARLGEPETHERLFTWRATDEIKGVTIVLCSDEHDMFMRFRHYLVVDVDPDITVGFNSDFFDWPYLIKRAQHNRWMDFLELGRLPHVRSHLKKASFESNAHGRREQTEPVTDGRISLDMCEWTRREYKDMRSYSLNAVAARFLGDQKEMLHHSQISRLWNGSSAMRARLGKYCCKDTRLTYRLMRDRIADVRLITMCRATRCDLNTILRRGAQIKSTVQIASIARQYGFVCPFADAKNNYEASYEGGLVLDRLPLFVPDYIGVFDFRSLYPSIMIADDLSWETYIPPEQLHRFSADEYRITPTGDAFIKPGVRKGLLPLQSIHLLNSRDAEKKKMAAAVKSGDKRMAAIYDSSQLAIKICGNSLYGYASATATGHLPLLAIGRSTTAIGRQSLQRVIDWFKEHYPQNTVLYGDTDSLFVLCAGMTFAEVDAWMKARAAEINALFSDRWPMAILPEKILQNTIFEAPKKYVALKHEGGKSELFFRGIEVVRRDSAPLVNRVMRTVCDMIMLKNDIEGAERFVSDVVADLYAGRIQIQELLMSKGLNREPDQYTNRQTHAELVKRMRQREAGTAPRVGDRIMFIMVADTESKKRTDWAEDPMLVLQHDIPINIAYYAEALEKPLARLLAPVIGEKRVRAIFHGDDSRVRIITIPTLHRPGTLLGFVVKLGAPCAFCRAVVPVTEKSPYCMICRTDEKKREALREQKKQELAQAEARLVEAERTCRKCQDLAAEDEIVCGARDCAELYTRHARSKAVEKALAVINNW